MAGGEKIMIFQAEAGSTCEHTCARSSLVCAGEGSEDTPLMYKCSDRTNGVGVCSCHRSDNNDSTSAG